MSSPSCHRAAVIILVRLCVIIIIADFHVHFGERVKNPLGVKVKLVSI